RTLLLYDWRPGAPLFFCIVRPLPGSTLFPYTTLFRSPHPDALRAAEGLQARAQRLEPAGGLREHLRFHHQASALVERGHGVHSLDRKSTRLNSSHVKISYAVFCLKKKNNEEQRMMWPT